MFRFLQLELHGWAFWGAIRIPLDANIVVLSGPNGSGKTTMLDAIRQVLHAPRLSQNRRISHYLRHPNSPALIRAVVSNVPDQRRRRPFERQQVFTDEATLACALVPNGGTPEKRYLVLPGRVESRELQERLLEGREWLRPEEYGRVLEYAGVSRSLMHILALEQGRADELSRQKPRELFRWVMEARGSQQVLERYTSARERYENSVRELDRQKGQILGSQAELASLDRQVKRLDEHLEKRERARVAEAIVTASKLQVRLAERDDINKHLPELRAKITSLLVTTDRLRRDIDAESLKLTGLHAEVEVSNTNAKEATRLCDEATEMRGELVSQIRDCDAQARELEGLTEEDIEELQRALQSAQKDMFLADQHRSNVRKTTDELQRRISALEQGIRRFPPEVEETLSALAGAGIVFVLAAERIEVLDAGWSSAIESALGMLRYAICVAPEQVARATEIARRCNFLGPIVISSGATTETAVAGPLQLSPGVPIWFRSWGESLTFAEDEELPRQPLVLTKRGVRRDDYGWWVSEVPDRVLGGHAIKEQLEKGRQEYTESCAEIELLERNCTAARSRISDFETRISVQRRRTLLIEGISRLPELENRLRDLNVDLEKKRAHREAANDDLLRLQKAVDTSAHALERKQKELQDRETELNNARGQIQGIENQLPTLEGTIDELRRNLDPNLIRKAEVRELTSPEMAEHDSRMADKALKTFEEEGPIPPESVRGQRRIVDRNLNELIEHVHARQSEADAARAELDRCRGDYLDVVNSTLNDYSRRARALADLASAKMEIELPRLENTDRSLDEAGIVVRIGFDGKRPTDLRDTSHSGGQQVVAGLTLLMSMAETEGNSFFIVDEPFAHLSLDRVDDVGRFLRGSGAQFLITVPTTLDRGQLDPASLLVVLRKKKPDESFASVPIVARA